MIFIQSSRGGIRSYILKSPKTLNNTLAVSATDNAVVSTQTDQSSNLNFLISNLQNQNGSQSNVQPVQDNNPWMIFTIVGGVVIAAVTGMVLLGKKTPPPIAPYGDNSKTISPSSPKVTLEPPKNEEPPLNEADKEILRVLELPPNEQIDYLNNSKDFQFAQFSNAERTQKLNEIYFKLSDLLARVDQNNLVESLSGLISREYPELKIVRMPIEHIQEALQMENAGAFFLPSKSDEEIEKDKQQTLKFIESIIPKAVDLQQDNQKSLAGFLSKQLNQKIDPENEKALEQAWQQFLSSSNVGFISFDRFSSSKKVANKLIHQIPSLADLQRELLTLSKDFLQSQVPHKAAEIRQASSEKELEPILFQLFIDRSPDAAKNFLKHNYKVSNWFKQYDIEPGFEPLMVLPAAGSFPEEYIGLSFIHELAHYLQFKKGLDTSLDSAFTIEDKQLFESNLKRIASREEIENVSGAIQKALCKRCLVETEVNYLVLELEAEHKLFVNSENGLLSLIEQAVYGNSNTKFLEANGNNFKFGLSSS